MAYWHGQYKLYNADLDNMFMHLTNVSIQTKADDYNDKHGGKWSLRNFRLYIEGQFGQERAAQVFEDIERIILLSLKSVQSVVINDKHCFECYGYDILVDDNLKSWLIEINASPSLSATTHSDRVMKHKLIIPGECSSRINDHRLVIWCSATVWMERTVMAHTVVDIGFVLKFDNICIKVTTND